MPADDIRVSMTVDQPTMIDDFEGHGPLTLVWRRRNDLDCWQLMATTGRLTDVRTCVLREVTALQLQTGHGTRIEEHLRPVTRAEIRRAFGWPTPPPPAEASIVPFDELPDEYAFAIFAPRESGPVVWRGLYGGADLTVRVSHNELGLDVSAAIRVGGIFEDGVRLTHLTRTDAPGVVYVLKQTMDREIDRLRNTSFAGGSRPMSYFGPMRHYGSGWASIEPRVMRDPPIANEFDNPAFRARPPRQPRTPPKPLPEPTLTTKGRRYVFDDED